jgi:serine phosphatase RsbU (regulator of sigma subunit)
MPREELYRWIRWVLFCLGFGLLPLFLVHFGLQRIDDRGELERQNRLSTRLVRLLEKIRSIGQEEVFYYEWLRRLTNRVRTAEVTSTTLHGKVRQLISELHQRVPGLFEFYILDRRGDLVTDLSAPVPSRHVVKKLYEGLLAARDRNDMQPLLSRRKTIEQFAGLSCRIEDFLESPARGKVITTGIGPRHSYFYYRVFHWGAIMVHINRGAVVPTFPLDFLTHSLSKRSPHLRLGVHQTAKPLRPSGLTEMADQSLRSALARFEIVPQETFFSHRVVGGILAQNATTRLWGVISPQDESERQRRETRQNLFLAGILALLALSSYGFMVPMPARWLSMGRKLLGLIVLVTGLPLIILLVTGREYLHEMEQTLIQQTYASMESNLKGLDSKFPLTLPTYGSVLKRGLAGARTATGSLDIEKFAGIVRRLQRRIPVSMPLVLGKDGEILLSSDRDHLFHQLGMQVLQTYHRSRGGSENETLRKKIKLDALLSTDKQISDLTSDIIRRIGQVGKIVFARLNRFLYIDIFFDPHGEAQNMLFYTWKPMNLHRDYLLRTLLFSQRQVKDSRLFAAIHGENDSAVPADAARLPHVRRMMDRIRARGGLVTDRAFINGQWFLIAGIPGRELDDYCLIQVSPLNLITRQVSRRQKDLALLALISILLAAGIGAALASQVLQPVKHLTDAVTAVAQRRFDHQIPVLENDELGSLSRTFNSMIEGLAELSVGRIVQENLFPPETIVVPGWHIHGKCLPATELGGDYFDYLLLPDGDLLVLIGDVSGHGVPAALIMAMAKATINNEIQHGVELPHLLSVLNSLIFQTMKRKRNMTFFLGRLTPSSGIFRYCMAGHCRPLLLRPAGQPEELGLESGYPLGVRAKTVFTPDQTLIAPGERLLFYTDGLPETLNPRGAPLNYDRLLALAQKHRLLAPPDAFSAIIADITAFHGSSSQDDDITLIILDRLP